MTDQAMAVVACLGTEVDVWRSDMPGVCHGYLIEQNATEVVVGYPLPRREDWPLDVVTERIPADKVTDIQPLHRAQYGHISYIVVDATPD